MSLKTAVRAGFSAHWGLTILASRGSPRFSSTGSLRPWSVLVDDNDGLVIPGLIGKAGMIALHTTDGGKTWKCDCCRRQCKISSMSAGAA